MILPLSEVPDRWTTQVELIARLRDEKSPSGLGQGPRSPSPQARVLSTQVDFLLRGKSNALGLVPWNGVDDSSPSAKRLESCHLLI